MQMPHCYPLCDGCLAAIASEMDSLKCSICNVQLHRHCAGIPQCHYKSISSSFVCLASSLAASKTIIADLRSEISALKEEVAKLKSALAVEKNVTQMLAAEISNSHHSSGETANTTMHPNGSRSYTSAARCCDQPHNHAPRRKVKQAQRPSRQHPEATTTPS